MCLYQLQVLKFDERPCELVVAFLTPPVQNSKIQTEHEAPLSQSVVILKIKIMWQTFAFFASAGHVSGNTAEVLMNASLFSFICIYGNLEQFELSIKWLVSTPSKYQQSHLQCIKHNQNTKYLQCK